MAERRMFAKTIIDSDAFLDMPLSSQALYFHLAMRADDDGFLNNPKKIQRMVGCSDDDLKLLLMKNFIIAFESGVVVIKHWRIHNVIQKDRYKPTVYTDEKEQLALKQNNAYTFADPTTDTGCIQNGNGMETQDRLGKDRLGKEDNAADAAAPADVHHAYGEYGWVKLTDDEYKRLIDDLGEAETKRCIQYVDESAQTTGNKNKWKGWNAVVRKCHRDGWGVRNENSAKKPAYDASQLGELPY